METKKFHNNSLLYLFSRVLENFPSFPKKVEKQFSRNCLFIIYLLFKDRQINRKKTVVNLYHLRSRSWGTQCRQISTDTQSGYSMIIAHRKATGHTFMPENCTLITKKTGMKQTCLSIQSLLKSYQVSLEEGGELPYQRSKTKGQYLSIKGHLQLVAAILQSF